MIYTTCQREIINTVSLTSFQKHAVSKSERFERRINIIKFPALIIIEALCSDLPRLYTGDTRQTTEVDCINYRVIQHERRG